KVKLPNSPEFYRLRIENQFIQLGADSSATVVIKADGKHFGKDYSVSGSKSCERIKDLSLIHAKTRIGIDSLRMQYKNKQLSDTAFQKKLDLLLDKDRRAAIKVICENPRSSAAYFALFLRLYNYLLFDPYDKKDNRYYAAVATSWDTLYPESLRSKNLVNLTLQGIKKIRQARSAKDIVIHEQDHLSYFEIKLPNIYGKIVPLSSQAGKVVLLDFTVYQAEFSPSRNLQFRGLYDQYNKQGFEIYQVSLDTEENLWKTGAANLPWICVRDRSGLRSGYLPLYNIKNIPTFFLMDRSGNLVARDEMISDLNKEIMKLL
ncbi:MAG: thioredoxin-like domain-containing protein, partial [Bacteroidales bacterium]|nr:thioredoxin-like domain-containing protein [Bacteroidales bacterium]